MKWPPVLGCGKRRRVSGQHSLPLQLVRAIPLLLQYADRVVTLAVVLGLFFQRGTGSLLPPIQYVNDALDGLLVEVIADPQHNSQTGQGSWLSS